MECKVGDAILHYEEYGTGRPILILHGWSLNAQLMVNDFEPVFSTQTGWRRIYLDLPGHGQSPVPNGLHNHDDLLDLLLNFIDSVAAGERLVVAANSWGGYLARGILHHRLEQVDGLMLFVPVIEKVFEKRILPARQIVHHDSAFDAALQPDEEWLKEMLVVQDTAILDEMRAYLLQATPQNPAIAPLNGTTFSFNPDALPKPCPTPTLIITGRQDDIVGYQQAWQILENFPRGTFVVLDRAGHVLSTEQKGLFHALVTEWLNRVEEYCAEKTA